MSTHSCNLDSNLDRSLRDRKRWGKKEDKKDKKSSSLPSYMKKKKKLFTNVVKREFFDRNAIPAYDGQKIASLDLDKSEMNILFANGRTRKIEDVRTRNYMWSPGCTRIVYVRLPDQYETTTKSLWLINVNTGRQAELYKTTETGSLRGAEWAPDGIWIYTIETLEPFKGLPTHRIIRINSRTKQKQIVREMVTDRSIYCFFNPPLPSFEYTGKVSAEPYEILYGTPRGLYICSPNGKTKRKIFDYSARGCDNSEWSPDKTQIALNFTGYGSKGEKITTGIWLYRVKEDKMQNLTKRTDIHTLWWSPDSKYVAYCNEETVWIYTYQPGEAKEGEKPAPGKYKCVAQIWKGEAPGDLEPVAEVESKTKDKKTTLRFKITIHNKGESKTSATQAEIYLGRSKMTSISVPEIEAGKTHEIKKGGSEWIEIKIPEKSLPDNVWVAVGMQKSQKQREITMANNFLKIPMPFEKDKYEAMADKARIMSLPQVEKKSSITGFYWDKKLKKNLMLITAGRWMYSLAKKEGEGLVVVPILHAPEHSFFGRPKYFAGKAIVTTYTDIHKKPKKSGGRK